MPLLPPAPVFQTAVQQPGPPPRAADRDRPTAAAAGQQARVEDDDDDERRAPETPITVTARRLDAARAGIEPALGASSYAISNDAIESRPGGETRNLGAVLLQAPGVTRDARGALVVRGQPGGVRYRLNGVDLPAGAGDLGEALSARLAASTELLTGALPAQYGGAPAGVVNVTTKDGHYLVGGQAELYGGAHGTIEPAAEWSAATGPTSLFVSGSYRRSDLGLLAPGPGNAPAHDGSRELEGFAYVDHVLDAGSRLSLIAGSINERRQIPTDPARRGALDSHDHYGILAYQRDDGPLTLQAAVSARASLRRLQAGVAIYPARERGTAYCVQAEGAYNLGAHTVRAGLLATTEQRDRRGLPRSGSIATRSGCSRRTNGRSRRR